MVTQKLIYTCPNELQFSTWATHFVSRCWWGLQPFSMFSKLLLPTERKMNKVWQCQIWDCHHRPHWICFPRHRIAAQLPHLNALLGPSSSCSKVQLRRSQSYSFFSSYSPFFHKESPWYIRGTSAGDWKAQGGKYPYSTAVRFVLCVCVCFGFELFCLSWSALILKLK